MFIDLGGGGVIYVLASLAFGEKFNWLNLLFLMVFFAFPGPDLDLIPFFILRKKLKLTTHHFFHFPLIFLPLGFVAGFWWGGLYGATLSFIGMTFHFVHDTFEPAEKKSGIQWLRPFSKNLFFFDKGKIHILPYQEWKQHLEELKKGVEKRSKWDEIMVRMEWPGKKTYIFLAASALLLVFHLVISR